MKNLRRITIIITAIIILGTTAMVKASADVGILLGVGTKENSSCPFSSYFYGDQCGNQSCWGGPNYQVTWQQPQFGRSYNTIGNDTALCGQGRPRFTFEGYGDPGNPTADANGENVSINMSLIGQPTLFYNWFSVASYSNGTYCRTPIYGTGSTANTTVYKEGDCKWNHVWFAEAPITCPAGVGVSCSADGTKATFTWTQNTVESLNLNHQPFDSFLPQPWGNDQWFWLGAPAFPAPPLVVDITPNTPYQYWFDGTRCSSNPTQFSCVPASPTPTPSASPTPTPTPWVGIHVKNPQLSPVPVLSFESYRGNATGKTVYEVASSFNLSDWTTSKPPYSSSYNEYGINLKSVAFPQLKILGVTPLAGPQPDYSSEVLSSPFRNNYLGWNNWSTGGRNINVIVATVTPTPTVIMPTPTPWFGGNFKTPAGVNYSFVTGYEGFTRKAFNSSVPNINGVTVSPNLYTPNNPFSMTKLPMPVGADRFGYDGIIRAEEVILGVTPVVGESPAHVLTFPNGPLKRFQIGWSDWSSDGKYADVIIATVTPTPTIIATPTSSPSPTPTTVPWLMTSRGNTFSNRFSGFSAANTVTNTNLTEYNNTSAYLSTYNYLQSGIGGTQTRLSAKNYSRNSYQDNNTIPKESSVSWFNFLNDKITAEAAQKYSLTPGTISDTSVNAMITSREGDAAIPTVFTVAGNLTLDNGSGNISCTNAKVVFLVSGNLTIDNNITSSNDDACLFVVRDNTTILQGPNNSATNATTTGYDRIEAFFITNKFISEIDANGDGLFIKGGIITNANQTTSPWTESDFKRTLGLTRNATSPAEIFEYDGTKYMYIFEEFLTYEKKYNIRERQFIQSILNQ